jgi:PAS domain S-box-containing protein
MSSPEPRLRPDHEIQFCHPAGVVPPAGSKSKQEPNATNPSQAESLLAAEKRTLEMMANGASLSEVLNDLCASIDAHAPPVASMVCLMDPDGKQLSPSASPHIPAALTAAITPWPIGPNRGSCGTAAFTKQRVIIPDISNDPRWPDEARDLALSHGFCAAWSEPLISKDGEVLGTFCLSYAEPRIPNSGDLELIQAAGHIALIAIELERSHRALKKALVEIKNSENKLRTIIDTIPALAWSARPDGSAEFLNRRWLDYAGLSPEQASDWGWTVAVHPDDRGRLVDYWRRILASGEAGEIEGRLRRFDGEYRWFLFRASPLRNDSGRIVKWYGTNTDIEERKRAEEVLRSNEQSLRLTLDSIPGFVSTSDAAGEIELVNRQILEYFGMTIEELKNWSASDNIHPDDLPRMIDAYRRSIETGQPLDFEQRSRGPDGVWRWFHNRSRPQRDADGRIVRWYYLATDIDARKEAEEELRRSKAYLTEAQRLSRTGSFGCRLSTGEMFWSEETFRIYGYDPSTQPSVERVLQRVHPEDRVLVQEHIEQATREGKDCHVECRLLLPDGSVKHICIVAHASKNESGITEFTGAVMDVSAAKHAEQKLRRSESYLAEAQRLTHTGSWAWQVAGRDAVHLSEEWYRIYGFDPEKGPPAWEERLLRIHPGDRGKWQGAIDRAIAEASGYEVEFRILLPDGTVKYIHTVGHPVLNSSGDLVQFVGTSTDITERKRGEEALRRSEAYLAEGQRMTRSGSWAWDVRSLDVFWSLEMFRIFDYDPEKTKPTLSLFLERVHPEDRPFVEQRAKMEVTQGGGVDSEGDYRIILEDGTIKHLHSMAHPLMNESGEVAEIVGTTMDVTEQHEARTALETALEQIKSLKDQLYNENVALREEIDRSSMFEEIVGASASLKTVLSSVVKVAPTDSTVLITGETGTGKELVARAIHKASQRATQAFISVNCASIPSSLIASELFGHEKGAFTGALQRHQGRFELADSGTIFLDEIGELPAETQIALLRVLQERQFERVGGSRVIPADVRIIAASNRDLSAAIASGVFRADLFYRLNVFPIHVPPLRNRKEDIPMLVEYFVKRYAEKAGKQINKIEKNTLKLCQSYPWPGNIRELQNIVERSVILCAGDTFWIDEAWLSSQTARHPELPGPLTKTLKNYEKELIEAALAESSGKVAGPNGAAVRLGIPRSTLDLKIKQLNIKKHTAR